MLLQSGKRGCGLGPARKFSRGEFRFRCEPNLQFQVNAIYEADDVGLGIQLAQPTMVGNAPSRTYLEILNGLNGTMCPDGADVRAMIGGKLIVTNLAAPMPGQLLLGRVQLTVSY
jgi:hypothetical protein